MPDRPGRHERSPMLHVVDRGSGPPVVLLHGQPGSASSWRPLIDQLEDGFRVLAPDRPGYGATTDDGRGFDGNTDLVARMVRDAGCGPAIVVGHSWGGGVALLLATDYPELVRGLVLVGSIGTPDSINFLDRLLNVRVLGSVLTSAGLVGIGSLLPRMRRWSRVLPDGAREYVHATFPDELLTDGVEGAWGRTKETFMTEQVALVGELPRITAVLPRITVPTAVVEGNWDVVVPPASARSLAAAIPGAELVPVPGVGHFVPRDAAPVLAAVIREIDHRAGRRPAGGVSSGR